MTGAVLLALLGSFTVSALVPVVNAEAILLGLVVASPAHAPVFATVAAVGQMIGKTGLYLGGHGLARPRVRERLERWRLEERTGRWRFVLLLTSATVGLPPFYLFSLAASSLGVRYGTFLVVGFLGRLLRFSLLVGLPILGLRAL